MAAVGVIGRMQLTNGGIQWLRSKALDVLHRLSKLPAIHLHCFVAVDTLSPTTIAK